MTRGVDSSAQGVMIMSHDTDHATRPGMDMLLRAWTWLIVALLAADKRLFDPVWLIAGHSHWLIWPQLNDNYALPRRLRANEWFWGNSSCLPYRSAQLWPGMKGQKTMNLYTLYWSEEDNRYMKRSVAAGRPVDEEGILNKVVVTYVE